MLKSGVRALIERTRMFGPGDLVVVAVSGGPDSTALLHVLVTLAAEHSIRLHVAHLNHRLRGAESDEDARFVRQLAAGLGLQATIEARDVLRLGRERRLGIEEAARAARYAFLAEVVDRLNAVGVAVGHTADDQVETVVMHWLRGSGLAGLRGMQPVSQIRLGPDAGGRVLKVFRPLLEVTRTDVLSYCRSERLPTRQDASNIDPRFLRNRVRNELLPLLEQYNPAIREAILRTAALAADDLAFLQAETQQEWSQVAAVKDTEIVFGLREWELVAPSIKRLLLREAIERLCGSLADISAAHIETALRMLAQSQTGATMVLPHRLQVVKRYQDFLVRRGSPSHPKLSEEGEPLSVPGETTVAGGFISVKARIADKPCVGEQSRWHADLDFGATGANLVVRRRLPGDRFRPLGMALEKKLQDFLVDSKVPREERDAIPILASPTQIVWVAGYRIDDRVKVTSSTDKVLCLTVTRREEREGDAARY